MCRWVMAGDEEHGGVCEAAEAAAGWEWGDVMRQGKLSNLRVALKADLKQFQRPDSRKLVRGLPFVFSLIAPPL